MIRESLKTWRNATELLVRILDVREEEKRDAVIEQVDKLLDERDALQPLFKHLLRMKRKHLDKSCFL